MSIRLNLLDERLIRYRNVDGRTHEATLPEVLAACVQDAVLDFPALRPHHRHPWHAFLVQLAALAMHVSCRETSIETADEWRAALLAITPEHGDGAGFSLVAPDDRPAFLQAPCDAGESGTWKKRFATPDALDMLTTSKNHNVKAARMTHASAEDWVFSLVSLQTQEGFLGAGNYGISRMNGGFASRPAFGVVPNGHWGKRWARDIRLLLEHRDDIARCYELKKDGGVALVWLRQWDGASSLSFSELDPFYIEVCRRVRLTEAIGDVRRVLWSALCGLLDNGNTTVSDEIKRKAGDFACEFEHAQDARFFDDLKDEVDAEADARDGVHDVWMLGLVDAAEKVLEGAFESGPRSAQRRYVAQAAALSRFHGGLRSDKHGPEHIVRVLRARDSERKDAQKRAQSESIDEV